MKNKKELELVSVIIPTYNREDLIIRSIESVLHQTYRNLELIVVDDCSTDCTEIKIREIHDDRLKYRKLRENSGACVARNVGIKQANGEYIAFQDSDDVWHPNKLEIQISEMKKEKTEISFCNMNQYYLDAKKLKVFPKNCKKKFLEYNDLLSQALISTQCLVAKKECFDNVKFDPNMPRLQDFDIAIRLAKRYKILHVDKELVDTYIQDDSISSNPGKGKRALNLIWEKYQDDFQKNSLARRNWHELMAGYLMDRGEDPSNEFKEALKSKYSTRNLIKYILARSNLLNFARSLRKKIH